MKTKSLQSIIFQAKKFSDNRNDPKFFDILVSSVLKTPHLKYQPPFLEIGSRRGGTALLILGMMKRSFNGAVLVTVDPYGEKPYDDKPYQYGSRFYCDMKRLLADFPNHIHYHLTSEEFIRIRTKIGYWFRGKRKDFSKFSFVYLDGSHDPTTVKMEFRHLFPLLIKGGYMLIDNTDFYDGEMNAYFVRQEKSPKMDVITLGEQALLRKT